MKLDKNFEYVFNELKRQFNCYEETIKAQDTKIGVMLGVILLSIMTILCLDNLKQYCSTNLWVGLAFTFGIALLILALIYGLKSYLLNEYLVGKNPKLLIDHYVKSDIKDYRKYIGEGIYRAIQENSSISSIKGFAINIMLSAYIFGILLIIFSVIFVKLQ